VCGGLQIAQAMFADVNQRHSVTHEVAGIREGPGRSLAGWTNRNRATAVVIGPVVPGLWRSTVQIGIPHSTISARRDSRIKASWRRGEGAER
jgi:hypothetical protein